MKENESLRHGKRLGEEPVSLSIQNVINHEGHHLTAINVTDPYDPNLDERTDGESSVKTATDHSSWLMIF